MRGGVTCLKGTKVTNVIGSDSHSLTRPPVMYDNVFFLIPAQIQVCHRCTRRVLLAIKWSKVHLIALNCHLCHACWFRKIVFYFDILTLHFAIELVNCCVCAGCSNSSHRKRIGAIFHAWVCFVQVKGRYMTAASKNAFMCSIQGTMPLSSTPLCLSRIPTSPSGLQCGVTSGNVRYVRPSKLISFYCG